jgi:hypothetical protein
MMRLKAIYYDELPYVRLLEGNYRYYQKKIYDTHGVSIPDWDTIPKSKRKYLYLVVNDFSITGYTKCGKKLVWHYKAGWFHDLASVPSLVRSYIDDNAPWIVIASLIHDACFGAHFNGIGFRQSNYFFLDAMYIAGAPFGKRNWSFVAVQTPIAYFGHWKKEQSHIDNERKFLELEVLS